jgi:uncharacterized protein (TIRG00374 family)
MRAMGRMLSSTSWPRAMRQSDRKLAVRVVQWGLVLALMAWAVRGIPLTEVARVLGRLKITQVALLVSVNLLILWSFSWRWWAVLRAMGPSIPTWRLACYRLAAFAVSYLTPGPQFGGEPLQVHLLSRREDLPASTAIASVVLDKALELVSNFTFLVVGVLVVLRLNIFPAGMRTSLLTLSILLMSAPAAYLLLSWRGVKPVSWILDRTDAAGRIWPGLAKWVDVIAEAEDTVSQFCRKHPTWLLAAVALSGLSWLIVLAEAWMAMHFLGITLGMLEAVGVVAAGRIAFLLPFPGGLGALEASQVMAVTALGFSGADGLGLGLFIRARDLTVAGIGGWLAVSLASERPVLARSETGVDGL